MSTADLAVIPQRVHLVGIGGIHMSAIAQILASRGHAVSGSDLRLSPLTQRLQSLGVTVHEGHAAAHVDDADLVVYTSAAHADNPELAEAERRGIPMVKRAAMVARLMEGKRVLAVAGSHGKTTTTSLLAYILWRAGLSPTFMLGGEMIDLDTNVMSGEGPYFVVEADEYDAAFLNYRPEIALVTNIDADHLDYYGSFKNLVDTFGRFLQQVTSTVVACGDNPALQATVREAIGDAGNSPVTSVSYGLDGEFDWTGEKIRPKGIDGYTFMVKCGKLIFGEFENRLAGVHNVRNCLGAITVAGMLGLSPQIISDAVSEFRGVKRRFQPVGKAAGVTIIDDYAHHPTEVEATLAAARQRYPDRRLVVLFQPHTYSRTQYLLPGFRTCFHDADRVLIAETYAAREEPQAGLGAPQLADAIEEPPAVYAGDLDESAQAVLDVLEPGDVFMTVGAGDVDAVGPKVLEALRR
ncbi:MAG TPA: UDP-N-acetylmuramate--L-alanine ligase [Dehalococcoidia bacterium]|nr:UDP-N-acetylmuramate--L-alanine ligase [Dehalococcoidia bacterium]